ncbi:hypothetical protein [Sulfurovum sp.]|uniref:hypothetical protein n=1 Tax=Sulfurovum sp. TaxID=1969726 RepID=UPI0028680C79|nr:hypothetical protein [Sulfurovum sp.]
MILLKLTLITLLSTFIHAVEPGHEGHNHAEGEHQEIAQKPQDIHYGTILEIKGAMGYKYLKIDEEGKELWVAISSAPVSVGDRIGYDKKTMMRDFKSKSLDKTFKEIFFASDVYLPQKVQKPKSMKEMLDLDPKQENKPTAPFVKKDTYSIEEIHMWRSHLEGQTISIEGSISKVSHEIMKLDWVHLSDGTGNTKMLTDDLIFTAANTNIKAEDKVIAKGKVVVNKDFGYGYFYKVIIQDASFQVK